MDSLFLSKQRGAAILLTVVLLLIMVTLVTLYTGKIQSFEHQILLNTQNQKWAQAAARAGLSQGLAMLNVNKAWQGAEITTELINASTFSISASNENLTASRQLVTLSAIGRSADRLAVATVTEQFLVYPVLFNQPPAPLMIKHGFATKGEFELITNPHGLGLDQPLSLWTDASITLSGTGHHSCTMSEFNHGNCRLNAYSDHSAKLSDIADSSATFPADTLGYLFNIPEKELPQLQQQADFVLSNCDELDINSWGLIWVQGDCNVSAITQIGSALEPIILIVFDGNVEFSEKVVMYGLLFSFRPQNSVKTLDLNMHTDSAVNGAIVANHQLGNQHGLTRVLYQSAVLERLQTSKNLQRVARVAGSRYDF